MTLKFARLDPDATLPKRSHPSDAGVDVFASADCWIPPFSCRVVPTGLTFSVPDGTFLEVRPRGRNNHLIGAGVVDAGYQGEILVKVVNYAWKPLRIRRGDAIAQLVHLPVFCDDLEELPPEALHPQATTRGATGGIHQR